MQDGVDALHERQHLGVVLEVGPLEHSLLLVVLGGAAVLHDLVVVAQAVSQQQPDASGRAGDEDPSPGPRGARVRVGVGHGSIIARRSARMAGKAVVEKPARS